jgi:hypothetical protein
MSTTIKDGKLTIDLQDLVRDEIMLREIAKTALFEKLVLTALASMIVSGEIDWQDGESPWWMGSSDYGPNFEEARVKLAELAPEGAQKLITELQRQRAVVVVQLQAYQSRAWSAERLVRWNIEALNAKCRNDERDMTELREICGRQAHVELDWSKVENITALLAKEDAAPEKARSESSET